MDLQFPHHENEIAQSEGATGCQFVNYWIHNGFVQVDEEKMSKSLGNFFTVREILARYQAEEIRYFILASHYRSPLNYTEDNLDKARGSLTRLYTALRDVSPGEPLPEEGEFRQRFQQAMNDDFNTPEALAVLFELARDLNRARDSDPAAASRLAATLRLLGGQLGLLQADPDTYLRGQPSTDAAGGLSDADIDARIQARLDARARKDWAEADRIRDELKAAGVVLEDAAGVTSWRRS